MTERTETGKQRSDEEKLSSLRRAYQKHIDNAVERIFASQMVFGEPYQREVVCMQEQDAFGHELSNGDQVYKADGTLAEELWKMRFDTDSFKGQVKQKVAQQVEEGRKPTPIDVEALLGKIRASAINPDSVKGDVDNPGY